MSEPYIAQVFVFPFGFAPKGWAMCNGQTMSIAQNQALFALLGTTYGGNGTTTFGLPNLQGRSTMAVANGYPLGATGGEANHTLIASEMPAHTHIPLAGAAATSHSPAGLLPGAGTNAAFYASSGNVTMNPNAVVSQGGGQAHNNMPPYLVLNFCIALVGIFPSSN
jgi:microcystin-dependent protein